MKLLNKTLRFPGASSFETTLENKGDHLFKEEYIEDIYFFT